MPARYVINLALVVGFYFLLTGLISSGIITNYWTGILITVGINIILAVSLNIATGYLGQLPLGHAGFMAVGAYAGGIFMKATPAAALLKEGNTAALIPYILGRDRHQRSGCRYFRCYHRYPGASPARRLSGHHHPGLR